MSLYSTFKILHVLLAFWFVTGIVGRQLVRRQMEDSRSLDEFRHLSELTGRFERLMVIPGSTALVLTGILAAFRGGWPMFGFLQGASVNWLLASNVLVLVMLLIVPLVFLPRGKRYDAALEAATAEDAITPELWAAFGDRAVAWAHRYEYAAIVAVIVLMVLKPF